MTTGVYANDDSELRNGGFQIKELVQSFFF